MNYNWMVKSPPRPPTEVDKLFEDVGKVTRAQRQLDRITGETELSLEQRRAVAEAQRRAGEVYATLSQSAPLPRASETALSYRARVINDLKKFAPSGWQEVDARELVRGPISVMEKEVYAAAVKRGLDFSYKGNLPPGQLRERVVYDEVGRPTTYFHGAFSDWANAFSSPSVAAVKAVILPNGRKLLP
jgi:hypothetical protein